MVEKYYCREGINCMKKIGILTFHKSINYGSVLQAWALCTALKEYNISIINYRLIYNRVVDKWLIYA